MIGGRPVELKGKPVMAYPKHVKTEHNGAKDMAAKGGWWGRRAEAKALCRKARRLIGRRLERQAMHSITHEE